MARPRADDYLEKQQLILDKAALLFARKGFAGTSMSTIAEECSASKALIYHYYESKESMLFDMLDTHCELLAQTAEKIMADQATGAEERLRHLLRAFMAIYVSARAKHVVLLNDLHWLAPAQQSQIRAKERRVVEIFKELVRLIRPQMPAETVTAMAMSLMGSINWTYIWFKEDGPLTPESFADITATMFFTGVASVAQNECIASNERVSQIEHVPQNDQHSGGRKAPLKKLAVKK